MEMYHGTDAKIVVLSSGSFVTRNIKDAWKFGYRRAVLNKSPSVFIYTAEVNDTEVERDPTRDRAFILLKTTRVSLFKTSSKWASPFKLSTFSPTKNPSQNANSSSICHKANRHASRS